MLRFENLADLFDYGKDGVLNDTTVYVDVKAFANVLFKKANS